MTGFHADLDEIQRAASGVRRTVGAARRIDVTAMSSRVAEALPGSRSGAQSPEVAAHLEAHCQAWQTAMEQHVSGLRGSAQTYAGADTRGVGRLRAAVAALRAGDVDLRAGAARGVGGAGR